MFTFPADVRDVKKVEEAVTATVAHFGCLDILVDDAATLRPSFLRAWFLLRTFAEFVVIRHADLRSYFISFRKRGPE